MIIKQMVISKQVKYIYIFKYVHIVWTTANTTEICRINVLKCNHMLVDGLTDDGIRIMMFIVLGPSKQSNDVVPRARRRTSSGELVMTMGQYSGIEVPSSDCY